MARRIVPWKPAGASELELGSIVAAFRHGLAAETPPVQKSATAARTMLEDWFKVPRTAALVAKSIGENLEGLLIFRSEAPVVRILHISAREYRHGVGSDLLGALAGICRSKGVKELRAAYSRQDERAKAFFTRKHKFVETGPGGEGVQGVPLVEVKLEIAE